MRAAMLQAVRWQHAAEKKLPRGEIFSCMGGLLALSPVRPREKKSGTKRRPGDPVRRFLL